MNISIRDRRKIIKVLSGILLMALAVMLMLNTIPASASGTGTTTKTGTYSKLSVNATASGESDMTVCSKVTNTGSAKRYVTVSVKIYQGSTYKGTDQKKGTIAAGLSLSSSALTCPKSYTTKGTSTIYGGTSSSAAALETLNVKH